MPCGVPGTSDFIEVGFASGDDGGMSETEGAGTGRALPGRGDLAALIARVSQLAASTSRTDLLERIENTSARLEDPNVRVYVVGEFKQGKSKLINALVNAPVCPIDDDVATLIPTVVGYGEEPEASVLVRTDGPTPGQADRQPIPITDLADFVSEQGNPGNERGLVGAEVLLPREILRGGLRLVDTPGVGGLDSAHALTTLSALSSAHAVILVSDASQEYTEPEMQLLRHAMRISPNVAGVLAKTDLYPEWRTIEAIDRRHLRDIGEMPLFAVSSDLRLLAAAEQDRDLNTESGFPDLVAHLRRDVLEQAELLNTRGALHDLRFVVDQLTLAARSELSALINPADTPRLLAELEDAKARAEEFRGVSSRWQVTLNDGVADLIADLEHDLRDRLRRVQREAEEAIDAGDPGPIWDEIAEWIDQRVGEAISESFVWSEERSGWLTQQVAAVFTTEETDLPTVEVATTDGILDPVDPIGGIDSGAMSAGERIYIGVRGSYGGLLMVGLATGLIGMSLINPLSLLAGILVGRRAYREDMSNRLARRRFEAKNTVRRYIDEVTFQVLKELKDRLRQVQRNARDYFGAFAEQRHRSISDALLAAKKAAGAYTEERNKRAAVLQAQIRQLEDTHTRIPELPPVQMAGLIAP